MDDNCSMKLEAAKTNEFTLRTLGEHRDEIHYIGVAADTVRNSSLKTKRLKQKIQINVPTAR